MDDTVSIIIPIYNVEKYLAKCIESVIGQTYKNLQIILVDDGATDNCPDICDKYKEKDRRIEVIHKENGGLSSARNAGLTAVKGKYIYFLDSDDYIESNLIEKCVGTINEENCDVVVFNYVSEDETGKVVSKSKFQPRNYIINNGEKKFDYISNTAIQYHKTGWNAWNRFYKADFIINNKITYPDNNIIFAEDLAYSLRVSLFTEKITVIPDALYHYLRRTTSIMGKTKKNVPLEKMIRLCADFENYAIENGYGELIEQNRKYIFPFIMRNEIGKLCDKFEDAALAAEKAIRSDELRRLFVCWLKEAKNSPALSIKNFGKGSFLQIYEVYLIFIGHKKSAVMLCRLTERIRRPVRRTKKEERSDKG